MIRVFARKTSMTPTDDLAFYDEPPLFDLPDLPVRVSVTFTWDIKRGRRLAAAWLTRTTQGVTIGGPAFQVHWRDEFIPGRFVKDGVTFTSRGCPKKCPWCLVPGREGSLREIAIQPGHRVQDNNVCACTQAHFERVCEMLSQQKKAAIFSGGLDLDYLTAWHVECLKKIRVAELWVACDTDAGLAKLDKAADLLSDFGIEKKRCYVLIGFREDAPAAEARCEAVYKKGFLPFAQFYRPTGGWVSVPQEWRFAQWKWSRPAVYRSKRKATTPDLMSV